VWFWFISLQKVKALTVKFPYVWSNERSSKRNKNLIRWRSHWLGAKLVKDANKNSFLTKLKKNFLNGRTGALKSREITLESNISFISVYLPWPERLWGPLSLLSNGYQGLFPWD
jgi:hypothetical protein